MRIGTARGAFPARPARRGLLPGALLAVLSVGVLATGPAGAETAKQGAPVLSAAASVTPGATAAGSASATVEQCLTAQAQAGRSATFSSEMTATSGTGRMSIRIELEERLPGEAAFHTVAAPGLGVWRSATPGIKVYRYIKQVTDLSAPALYRAAARFRWLTAKGKLIKAVERRTLSCTQPFSATATAAVAG